MMNFSSGTSHRRVTIRNDWGADGLTQRWTPASDYDGSTGVGTPNGDTFMTAIAGK